MSTGIFLGVLGVVDFVLYLRRSAPLEADPDRKPGAAADRAKAHGGCISSRTQLIDRCLERFDSGDCDAGV